MYSKILKKLSQTSALTFSPVSQEKLVKMRKSLVQNKFSPLPLDYIKFLQETDGLLWNGIRFFGIEEHDRPQKSYTFPNILKVNQDFAKRNRPADFLILGDKDEDLLVYDNKQNVYLLVDKMDLISDLSLPRFFDVLYLLTQDFVG